MKLLIITTLFYASLSMASLSGRIVGGEEATPGEFPFLVSVQLNGSHLCGGMIVSRRWVLTAAHCIFKGKMTVVSGIHHLEQKNRKNTFRVVRKYKHPKYDDLMSEYDFALLKVNKPLPNKLVQLNSKKISESAKVNFTVAGWGLQSEDASELSKVLNKVQVPFVDSKQCSVPYGTLSPSMICAGYHQGLKDSCQGDSGGPLLYIDDNGTIRLVGVVSFGEGCARPGKFGVYARVSHVIDWIRKKTK